MKTGLNVAVRGENVTMANLLLIGGGGREHALAWTLSKNQEICRIFVIPGNAGTDQVPKCENITGIKESDCAAILSFCTSKNVSFCVIGPEEPLANGLVDVLEKQGIPCFGPYRDAAKIEASKAFAKNFMSKHGIPTADYNVFDDFSAAVNCIQSKQKKWVVKASGLAAGKGVIICSNNDEALNAVQIIMKEKKFSDAGNTVVVEEFLDGEEISALCFTDGHTIMMLPLAQDHKRLLNNDEGPNTGGMGAYCPYPASADLIAYIEKEILQKTVDSLRTDGIKYKGILFAGLMLTKDGVKVLEYNCRFGDPETQAILPLLESDLFELMRACVTERLAEKSLKLRIGKSCCGVVLASQGYPENYRKGVVIENLDELITKFSDTHVFHAGTTRDINDETKIVTAGGRVLCVVAIRENLETAAQIATNAASFIRFDGAHFRTDIAHKALKKPKVNGAYAISGVSIDAGDELIELIKRPCRETTRDGCISEIGGFGGLFDPRKAGYKDPILVSGTDGVGTKLLVAQMCRNLHSIGQDLVAMCVNDILVHGAEPLFFLDYFATGKLNKEVAKDVICGIAQGCQLANCALIGGETAEMPGMYSGEIFDIAGFAVGAIERDFPILPLKDKILPGDIVLGIESSGIHSNGFSLVRMIVEKIANLSYSDQCPWNSSETLGNCLLEPTKIYVRQLLPILRSTRVKAAAHITGGGLLENIPRVLPEKLSVKIDASTWIIPEVFRFLATVGMVSPMEMMRTFNCGVGMVLIVGEKDLDFVESELSKTSEKCHRIGTVVVESGVESKVYIDHIENAFRREIPAKISNGFHVESNRKIKVGALISGSGTNLQALIDHCSNPYNRSVCEIVLIVSNVPNVFGLQRAKNAGIENRVLNHKDFKSRDEFDAALNKMLNQCGVELICMAGFMRILTSWFCEQWHGRLLNLHPSLLPAFPGKDAVKMALAAGVRITGCTVHQATADVDSGEIIEQAAVSVKLDDSEASLLERIHVEEHRIYPIAMERVAQKMRTMSK